MTLEIGRTLPPAQQAMRFMMASSSAGDFWVR
jgi:hypothetical protein